MMSSSMISALSGGSGSVVRFGSTMSKRIPRTGYHLVDPSPWPILVSAGVVNEAASFISFVHNGAYTLVNFVCATWLLLSSFCSWMLDIIVEATYLGCHTSIVARGLKVGFSLFLISEAFFFVGFFWAWFSAGIGNLSAGCMWPIRPVIPVYPWGAPLFNTAVLLASGAAVTWAHRAVATHNREEAMIPLGLCVLAGVVFLRLQFGEYKAASFTIADGVYGSSFYMLTGLHGSHVLGGTLFLAVMWIRNYYCHFVWPFRHMGFLFAVWYWHFVDVIWLVVFVWAYVWPYKNWVGNKLL
uniref:Cytochrome c oxidase subunit 3 n=1 Tax=Semele scabra TaxID=1125679 RepID=I6NHU5_9BIVA|nr:cytochrome c oxidase subunit III [Semele scabra]AEV94313.1 cytochrome c oxidase subunit III [Semele scabra]